MRSRKLSNNRDAFVQELIIYFNLLIRINFAETRDAPPGNFDEQLRVEVPAEKNIFRVTSRQERLPKPENPLFDARGGT